MPLSPTGGSKEAVAPDQSRRCRETVTKHRPIKIIEKRLGIRRAFGLLGKRKRLFGRARRFRSGGRGGIGRPRGRFRGRCGRGAGQRLGENADVGRNNRWIVGNGARVLHVRLCERRQR